MNLFKLCLEKSEIDQKNENQATHKSSGTGGTATKKEAAKPENTKAGGCPTRCPISEAKRPTTEETLQHNSEDQAILIDRMIRWVDRCDVWDEWQIPTSLIRKSHKLQRMADNAAQNSRNGIRIWKIKENYLTCCPWSRRFEDLNVKKIEGATTRNQ